MDERLQHVFGALLEVVGRERVDDSKEVNRRRHLQIRPVSCKNSATELAEYMVHGRTT